ncbi:MAG: hypothetical protein KGD57_02940 [Candidatus Lokiarchaeota archaeon]|nr:hypothetical protein [Candidatus Lokiarchaeota archaeon]
MANNENNTSKEEDIIGKAYQDQDENSLDLKQEEKFDKEENNSPSIESVFDDIFVDITTSDKAEEELIDIEETSNTNIVFESGLNEIIEDASLDVIEEDNNVDRHKVKLTRELELFHEGRIKELEEQIKEYNTKYQKLEDKIQEYQEKNQGLIEKRTELEEVVKSFEEKTNLLEESKKEFNERSEQLQGSKEEFSDRSMKLQEAREQFMNLSRQMEEKKIDLEKRENNIEKRQRTVNKEKFDFEKNKIEFEKIKLDYEMGKADLEINLQKLDTKNYEKEPKDDEYKEIIVEKEKEVRGKEEILNDLLQQLMIEGGFNSCYLIDGKGMLISEYSKTKFDTVAIGAMFSLMSTNLLRTVNSLDLLELKHFKFTSANGEFMVRNISIMNYERNFILLAYYDESNSFIPKLEQNFDRKTMKRLVKSAKKDFYSFGNGKKISWILDNLVEKVNFLKQKSQMMERDIEAIRLDALSTTSNKIKGLFEI